MEVGFLREANSGGDYEEGNRRARVDARRCRKFKKIEKQPHMQSRRTSEVCLGSIKWDGSRPLKTLVNLASFCQNTMAPRGELRFILSIRIGLAVLALRRIAKFFPAPGMRKLANLHGR